MHSLLEQVRQVYSPSTFSQWIVLSVLKSGILISSLEKADGSSGWPVNIADWRLRLITTCNFSTKSIPRSPGRSGRTSVKLSSLRVNYHWTVWMIHFIFIQLFNINSRVNGRTKVRMNDGIKASNETMTDVELFETHLTSLHSWTNWRSLTFPIIYTIDMSSIYIGPSYCIHSTTEENYILHSITASKIKGSGRTLQ